MAEYKGKLLKGLFTQAKNVILNSGSTLESVLTKRSETSSSISLAGNSSTSITISAPGAFAVVGVNFTVGYIETCSFSVGTNNITIKCRNPNSAAETFTVTVDYLAK